MSTDDGRLAAAALEVGLDLTGVPGAGALLGLVPGLVAQEHRRRQSVALRTAEQLSGLSREELADALRASRPAVNATVAFLFAVGEAGDDEVLVMIGATLARALAGAAEDSRSPLSEEQMVLRALRGLTSDHVRLMIAMRDFEPDAPESADSAIVARADIPISVDQLREQRLVPDRLLTALLAYLELHGLTEYPHGRLGGGTYWELSELGRLVLRAGDEAHSRS